MKRYKVTPRFAENTNRSNGFEDGVSYSAVVHHAGYTYTVTLPCPQGGTMQRSVGLDGGGGAHLQWTNGRTGTAFACETAGYFEIEEIE